MSQETSLSTGCNTELTFSYKQPSTSTIALFPLTAKFFNRPHFLILHSTSPSENSVGSTSKIYLGSGPSGQIEDQNE